MQTKLPLQDKPGVISTAKRASSRQKEERLHKDSVMESEQPGTEIREGTACSSTSGSNGTSEMQIAGAMVF